MQDGLNNRRSNSLNSVSDLVVAAGEGGPTRAITSAQIPMSDSESRL